MTSFSVLAYTEDVKKQISLLQKGTTGVLFVQRLTDWLTTVGRAILLFVELIVFLAFFSRFWLDARNNDLAQLVRQRRAILTSLMSFENDFRLLTARLQQTKDILKKEQEPLTNSLDDLATQLPPNISFRSFTLHSIKGQQRIYLALNVTTPEALALFLNRLARDPQVVKVEMGRAEKNSLETGTVLSLVVEMKNKSK